MPKSNGPSAVSVIFADVKWKNVVATLLLLILLAGAGMAAWRIPIPAKLPTVAWNSEWVFRAEIFVGCFIAVYVLTVVCLSTIIRGRPPKKLSFGLLSFEEAEFGKAVEALSEGGTALQAVESELSAVQQTLDETLAASQKALSSLIEAADNGGASGPDLERARDALKALPSATRVPGESRRDFDRAMGRFEQLLTQLDEAKRTERPD
jgi:hypothetical protein